MKTPRNLQATVELQKPATAARSRKRSQSQASKTSATGRKVSFAKKLVHAKAVTPVPKAAKAKRATSTSLESARKPAKATTKKAAAATATAKASKVPTKKQSGKAAKTTSGTSGANNANTQSQLATPASAAAGKTPRSPKAGKGKGKAAGGQKAPRPSRSKLLTTKATFAPHERNGFYDYDVTEALKSHIPEDLIQKMRDAVAKTLTFRADGIQYGNIDAVVENSEVIRLAEEISQAIAKIPRHFKRPIRPLTPKFIQSVLGAKFHCIRTKTLWTVEYDKDMPDDFDDSDMFDFGYNPFHSYWD